MKRSKLNQPKAQSPTLRARVAQKIKNPKAVLATATAAETPSVGPPSAPQLPPNTDPAKPPDATTSNFAQKKTDGFAGHSAPPQADEELKVIDLSLDPGVEPSDLLLLSDQQERAMLALSRGQSVTAAALAAGVHRGTVHRWLRESADFTAAYNAWQSELRQSARTRLMRLADQAVDVVTNALQSHDAKTAVALLKNFALLAPIEPGSTSAEVISHEWNREKQKENRKREIEKTMMELGMI